MNTKALERAESYKSMMNMWAWKDWVSVMLLEKETAKEIAIDSDEIKTVYFQKGKVKCIDSLMSELDSIVNPR